jgi:hypothetical protein
MRRKVLDLLINIILLVLLIALVTLDVQAYRGIFLIQPSEIVTRDPRCSGAGRYEAMRDADLSGQGLGHACQ